MASIVFLDSCGNATYANEFLTGTAGTGTAFAVSATQAHTGTKSYAAASGVGNGTSLGYTDGVLADVGRRISFWFYFDGNNTAQCGIWRSTQAGNVNASLVLALTTGQKLILLGAGGGGTFGTGTTALVAGTWYRISIAYTVTDTTHNTATVYLNGSQEITNSNITLINVAATSNQLGWINAPGASKTAYYSDLYIDDGTTGDPGDIRCTYKAPGAVQNANWDTTLGTGAVNERPISETNGKEDLLGSGGDTQDYLIQAPAGGDVDISADAVVGYMGWWWAKKGTAPGNADFVLPDGNHTKSVGTTSALYTQAVTTTAYPTGNIGMAQVGIAVQLFLYECGVIVAYSATQTIFPGVGFVGPAIAPPRPFMIGY